MQMFILNISIYILIFSFISFLFILIFSIFFLSFLLFSFSHFFILQEFSSLLLFCMFNLIKIYYKLLLLFYSYYVL